MVRWALAAFVVVWTGRAEAGRVCAQPAVVERVAGLLSAAGRAVRLDVESVGEVSSVPGRVVRCAVRGQTVGYDTNQRGVQPIDARFVVQYTLELRQNGIFLHLE